CGPEGARGLLGVQSVARGDVLDRLLPRVGAVRLRLPGVVRRAYEAALAVRDREDALGGRARDVLALDLVRALHTELGDGAVRPDGVGRVVAFRAGVDQRLAT